MTSYTWLKKQPKYLWVNGVLPDFTWLTVRQTSSPGREIGKSNRRDTKYAVNELSWKPIKTMTEWCHAETDILTKGQGFQPLEKSWKPGKWKKLFPDLEKSWNLKKVQKGLLRSLLSCLLRPETPKTSETPETSEISCGIWDHWGKKVYTGYVCFLFFSEKCILFCIVTFTC